jgi:signal transduction histidine kinase
MSSEPTEPGAGASVRGFFLRAGVLTGVAVVSIATLLISLYVGFTVQQRDRAETERRVAAVSRELAREYSSGGAPALMAEIRAFEGAGEFRIGLRTSDNQVLVDHALSSPRRLGWSEYVRRDAGAPHTSLVLIQALGDGFTLGVASDLPDPAAMRTAIVTAALSGALLLFILALAYFAAQRTQSELRAAAQTMARIGGGDLALRVALPARAGPLRTLCELGNRLIDDIEKRDQSIRAAMKTVAHELRTPLSHAISQTEVLRSAEADAEEKERAAASLDRNLRVLADSFEALLRLARIEQAAPADMVVDLAAKVRNVADAYSAALDEHGVKLTLDCREASVRMDRDLGYLLISALLDNAIKHTPPGTEVVLRTWRESGACHFEYSDDGPGLPLDERAHAAERFFRGSGARGEGLGLGLTIVAAIIESARGTMRIEGGQAGFRLRAVFPAAANGSGKPAELT